MTRPRIRTLKPEAWQDERVGGSLTRDGRLLMVVLITMADDEGRLRAAPSMILGHGYPYDEDAARKLPGWLAELEATRVILRYEVDGKPYIAFRHWKRHQKVNRANASTLPAPPDPVVVSENAVKDHDGLTEPSVKDHDFPTEGARSRAQARGPIRSDPEEKNSNGPSRTREAADPDKIPDDFPPDLAPVLDAVVPILHRIAAAKGADEPTRAAVARTMAAYPRRPHVECADDLEHWLVHGTGRTQRPKDVVGYWRNQLKRQADRASAAVGGNGQPRRRVIPA
jgi:hypothetical protein